MNHFEIIRHPIKKTSSDFHKIKDIKNVVSRLYKYKEDEVIDTGIGHLLKGIRNTRESNRKENIYIPYEIKFTHRLLTSPVVYVFDYFLNVDRISQHFKIAFNSYKKEIRNKRKELNTKQYIEKAFTSSDGKVHTYKLIGRSSGVHQNNNTFLNIKRWKDISKIFDSKLPTTPDNHVGIEIEFYCDWDKETLAAKFYEENLTQYLCLKTDGSIKPEEGKIAHELCVLCEEKDIETIINKVYKVLQESNARVNKSCGTHVHLDMRNRDAKIVFSNLVSCQDFLYGMNPSHRSGDQGRRSNGMGYSKRVKSRTIQVTSDRYYGINANSMRTLKTIEVRVHAGIIEARKIINWCKLLITICSQPTEVKYGPKTLLGLKRKFKVDQNIIDYVKERIDTFQNGSLDIEEAA